jgi:hypothetical protein
LLLTFARIHRATILEIVVALLVPRFVSMLGTLKRGFEFQFLSHDCPGCCQKLTLALSGAALCRTKDSA